ncbi:hypothetical protein QQS21_009704 [Conoideocrella luteorostrata]|uniref:Uncharacterized protein n=1 Tax=Conoideocrella luteorostrata TaxID=1105319 RepID=A0AAJ0CJ40_9HYPO|nr:hypothetical protein QQS21_009704 [Conoideocrella luteorostrata]
MANSAQLSKIITELCQQKISPQQAANLFAQPIEQSEDPGSMLFTAWDHVHHAMIKASSDVDGHQIALVDMMAILKRRPDVDLRGKRKTGSISDEAKEKLWSDLPAYSWSLSDLVWWYHGNSWRKEPVRYGSTDNRAEIVSIAAAEARLTASGVADFSIECYERLADTLEDAHNSFDMELPAVREILVLAGKVLYSRMGKDEAQLRMESNQEIKKGIEQGQKHSAMSGSRRLYSGRGAIPEERWQFWAKRLVDIQEDDNMSTKTQAVAKEAWGAISAVLA